MEDIRSEIDLLKNNNTPPERVNVEEHSDVFEVPEKTETGELRDKRRQQAAVYIAKIMEQAYGQADIRQLCFVFHIDFESIPGEMKRDKIRSLVRHFYHRNTLRVLVEFLERDRPQWVWRVKNGE